VNLNSLGGLSVCGALISGSLVFAQSQPSITEYVMPNPGGEPGGIITGSDGALWFQGGGRITTDGIFTEYPIPASGGGSGGITAGPDGALWFTDFSGNNIGRITTIGAVTLYPIPAPNSNPIGIAPGPDGALWFTEAANKIGRITTAGVITEYTVPTPFSGPTGITAGSDGALWFTEVNGGKIGPPTDTWHLRWRWTNIPEFDTPPGGRIATLGIRIPASLTFTTLPALVK
jgi:virginiamycin B lyase